MPNSIENAIDSAYDDLETQVNDITAEINAAVADIQAAVDKIAYLGGEFANLPNEIKKITDQLKLIGDFFSDDTLVTAVSAVSKLGDGFIKMSNDVKNADFDPKKVFADAGGSLVDAANSILVWITNALITPTTGVIKESPLDCWWTSLNDGTVYFDVGISTGPSIGLGITFQGPTPVRCFIQKLRLFSHVLARTEPTVLPEGFDVIQNVYKSAVALRDAANAISIIKNGQKPAWCNSSFGVNVNIDPNVVPFDFLQDIVDAVNGLNVIVGPDGVIGQAVTEIKKVVCEAAEIPAEAATFADNLVNELEGKKLIEPTAFANRLFKSIKNTGEKFLNQLDSFESKYVNDTAKTGNCFLDAWNQKLIGLSFGISATVSVFPPTAFDFGAAFTCVTLDCWGCVTGLDKVIGLLPVKKRGVLATNSSASTSSTLAFLSDGYTSSSLNQCEKVKCDRGTWNDRVCVCNCDNVAEIFTLQYGCYNADDFANGKAPDGAKPEANPNNDNYDSTVDPGSSDYNSAKDPNPYYKPFELAPQDSSSLICFSVLLVLAALLL